MAYYPLKSNTFGEVYFTDPDLATTGTAGALNATVSTAVNAQGVVGIQITGTWVGTISFFATEDPAGAAAASSSWFAINGVRSVTGAQVSTTTSNGQFRVNSGGYTAVFAQMTAWTSGTATIWLNATGTNSMTTLAEPLPAGTNTIGTVNVSGTVPVSLATNTPVIATGANVIGSLVANQSVNNTQLNGVAVLAGNGVTGTGSQRVTIASDNTTNTNPWLVTEQKAATAVLTSVVAAITSTTCLAANTARKGAYFFNDSTSVLFLAFAATASATAYTVQIPAGGFYEMPEKPLYTGLITGIWTTANGSLRVTELS